LNVGSSLSFSGPSVNGFPTIPFSLSNTLINSLYYYKSFNNLLYSTDLKILTNFLNLNNFHFIPLFLLFLKL
jgi:hypothetical protein